MLKNVSIFPLVGQPCAVCHIKRINSFDCMKKFMLICHSALPNIQALSIIVSVLHSVGKDMFYTTFRVRVCRPQFQNGTVG